MRKVRYLPSIKNSMLILAVIMISSGCSESPTDDGDDILRLGTATKSGGYYNLGMSIKSISQNFVGIEVIETGGSVDNIYRLIKGEIDIAIVQNDIAFFAENGLFPFADKVNELAGIITFYPEPIFIVTRKSDIYNLTQLKNLTVNIGPVGSGLRTDSKIILNSIGLWDEVKKTEFKPTEVLSRLLTGQIHAAFVNILTEEYLKSINAGRLFTISLPGRYIENLRSTYPYFNEYQNRAIDETFSTIAVKSILICRKDADTEMVFQLSKVLYKNFDKLIFPEGVTRDHYQRVLYSMSLIDWHEGSRKYYQEIGILDSQAYKIIWWVLAFFISAVLLLIIFDVILFAFNRSNLRLISVHSRFLWFIKSVNLKVIQHKYIMVLLIIATAYLTIIVIVQRVEHEWAISKNTVSNFDSPSFSRNLVWILNFSGSGYDDNLFPQSLLGKFFVSLIPLIGIGSFFTIVGFLTSDHIKSKILEARGMKTKMTKNHIIICGWNENVPFLVRNLIHKNIAYIRPIIILADIQEELPLEKYGINNHMVGYVRGEATSKIDLERANLKDADIAVIVLDSNSSEPDAKNVLKILTIEKYCHKLELSGHRKNRANIYTIAELQNLEIFEAARDAFVDEVISFGHIKTKILVQSILNPGVSTFLENILTYNEYNDIYSVQIKRDSNLTNKSFDELLLELRRHNVLLLSINVNFRQSREEMEKFKKKYNLTRSVLTNPVNDSERNYKTQKGDILIVLTQNQRMVDKAIQKIEKQ